VVKYGVDFKQDRQVWRHDFQPARERFLAEVLAGLQKRQKELPAKYFYDQRGSDLFRQICTLDEYYIPVIETTIMADHIEEIVGLLGEKVLLVEYGCGDCIKTRILLDHLHRPAGYIPVDISREQLLGISRELSLDYSELEVLPVCADYSHDFILPTPRQPYERIVVYFPGSAIGNFSHITAGQFLQRIAAVCGLGGGLLIGVDLKKETDVLNRAYNDSLGVTAAFNLNLLERINRELDADFQLDYFRHSAFYNLQQGRVEMYLVSMKDQLVHLDNTIISFTEGERIWTESSYKYDTDAFEQLADAAGFRLKQFWTDTRQWFSVQYLVNTEGAVR
jgi:dimethylhistidine N-methyltransferase